MREEAEPPRKKSETLPKSGEIHKALLAYSRDAILGVNRKGTIVFWNEGAQRIFGYSSEEVLGKPLTKLISEQHREGHTPILHAFLGGNCGKTGLVESEAIRKDGTTFPIEFSLSLEPHNGRSWTLIVGRNIVSSKHVDNLLRESAEHYCNLFENCLEAVFSANEQDDSGAGSEAIEKLGRYCLEELAELKPADNLPPEGRELLSRQVDKLLGADEPVASIVREILRKDGRRILIEQYLNFLRIKAKAAGLQDLHSDDAEHSLAEEQLKSSFINLAKVISHVIELCDPYTAKHQERVAELACLVARNMGLADEVIERLYFNGLLHDIGKISIPRSILTKPGELTDEEWALIRAHTRQGYRILKDAKLPWPVADVALQHHERLDGSGYPNGIAGDELNLEVGILAVCDVVEAMSSHRPYRPARTTGDILKELTDGRGTKYDASVVDVVLSKVESGEFRSTWNGRNSEIVAT